MAIWEECWPHPVSLCLPECPVHLLEAVWPWEGCGMDETSSFELLFKSQSVVCLQGSWSLESGVESVFLKCK